MFPSSDCSVPFYSVLFLSFAVFYFARSFAFLLFPFLLYFRDYLALLYFTSILARSALFRFVTFSPSHFRCCPFTPSLFLSLSFPFSLFSPSTSLHQPQCFSPFSGLCSRFVSPYFALSCICFFAVFRFSLCLLPPHIIGLLLIFFARYFSFAVL